MNGRVYQDRTNIIRLSAYIGATPDAVIDVYDSPLISLFPTEYFSMSGETRDVEGATRVCVFGSNDTQSLASSQDAEVLIGQSLYEISDNPILKATIASASTIHNAVATNVLAAYRFDINAREVEWRADPSLEAYDVIGLVGIDGKTYDARITQTTLKYNGGLRGTLSVRARPSGQIDMHVRIVIVDHISIYQQVPDMYANEISFILNADGALEADKSGVFEYAWIGIDDDGNAYMA